VVLGRQLQLGHLYLFYITCLGIYKTNTINIMAGINGLEVGQSIVAASSMLLYFFASTFVKGGGEKYVYSIVLLIIFLGGALVLLKDNQYPAKIFIGDTFCYYAGIVLAIAAIYGTFFNIQARSPSFATGSSSLSSSTFYTPSPNSRAGTPVPGIGWPSTTTRIIN